MSSVASIIEFSRKAEPTSELIPTLVDYLANREQRESGGPRLLTLLAQRYDEEGDEDDNLLSNLSVPVKVAGRATGLSLFAKLAAFFLKKGLSYSKALVRWIVRTAGRALLRFALVPIMKVLTVLLTTPPGLVITGIVSTVGLGYFLYKTMFKGERPLRDLTGVDATAAPRAGRGVRDILGSRGSSGVYEGDYSAAPISTDPVVMSDAKVSEGQRILERHRSARIRESIKEASRRTGMSEDILTAIAYKESGFQAIASPGTSSAQGLFQFIGGTWKATLGRYGKQYGVSPNASRNDPLASAIMAGAYLKHDIYPSISKIRPNPSATDLYMGHFMGPGGGRSFLRNMDRNPNRYAYQDFAVAAQSNPWVYYHDFKRLGRSRPRTYQEIYNMFASDLQMIQAAVQKENRTYGDGTSTSEPYTVPQSTVPPHQLTDQGIAGTEVNNSKTQRNTSTDEDQPGRESTEDEPLDRELVLIDDMLVRL